MSHRTSEILAGVLLTVGAVFAFASLWVVALPLLLAGLAPFSIKERRDSRKPRNTEKEVAAV